MYIGFSVQMGGSSSVACADIRVGLAESKSLRYLNLNHTMFQPVDMIPILGTLTIYVWSMIGSILVDHSIY